MLDQYAQCPCGSGKKLKWCCGPIQPRIDRLWDLLASHQEERAFQLLDQLEREGHNPPMMKLTRVQSLFMAGKSAEAQELAGRITKEHPDFGRGWEVHGGILLSTGRIEAGLECFREALVHYAPEAIERRVGVLKQMGHGQLLLSRPLAAWAAWQQAAKLAPTDVEVPEWLETHIRHQPMLPNFARGGGMLKSPDALAVFNDDRRAKWDEAIRRHNDWHLNDLVELFRFLTDDDRTDAAAWFNLALAYAWTGDNLRAIEALEEYLKLEPEFEPAADAAHLGEVLRMSDGVEELSDYAFISAIYATEDAKSVMNALAEANRLIVVRLSREESSAPNLVFLDQPVRPNAAGPPLIGVRPRVWGMVVPIAAQVLRLTVWRHLDFPKVCREFEDLAGGKLALQRHFVHQANPALLDAEVVFSHAAESVGTGTKGDEKLSQDFARFFEEQWLCRPLRSLGGLAPIDAVGDKKLRARVEGIIRLRETAGGPSVIYDFERLRNKLGLMTLRTLDGSPARPAEVSAYSAAQLSELNPAELSDADLHAAYTAANGLDAPTLALRFAAQMVHRDNLADRLDMAAVFRRLVVDALERRQVERALEWLEMGQRYDQQHYDGQKRLELEGLRARYHLAKGETEAACNVYHALCDADAENLELIAGAVENLLSAGAYPSAQEFAAMGLRKAESLRRSSHQAQFKEYLAAAGATR